MKYLISQLSRPAQEGEREQRQRQRKVKPRVSCAVRADKIQSGNSVERTQIPERDVHNFERLARMAPHAEGKGKRGDKNCCREKGDQASRISTECKSQRRAAACDQRDEEARDPLRGELTPQGRCRSEGQLLHVMTNFAAADRRPEQQRPDPRIGENKFAHGRRRG